MSRLTWACIGSGKKSQVKEVENDDFAELQDYVKDPSKHYRYAMFKDKLFSDFNLICKEQSYSVHKLILFSNSRYFERMLNSEWKESAKSTVEFPDQVISNEAFEAFLVFLYTNSVECSVLKKYLLDLFYLSDYFQVETLKKVTLRGLKKFLNIETVQLYLPRIRTCHIPELIEIFTTFIATNHETLSLGDFPFHQLGKTLLLIVLEKIVAKKANMPPSRHIYAGVNETIRIGDPSTDPLYSTFKEGKFSDVSITWNNEKKIYKLHKSVLAAGSPYFKRFLQGKIRKLKKSKIASTEAFEVFLAFIYTNCISEDNMKVFSLDLFDLAVHFEVDSLEELSLRKFRQQTSAESIEDFLPIVRQINHYKLKLVYAELIATHCVKLVGKNFPFHKVGKIILLQTIRRIGEIYGAHSDPRVSSLLSPLQYGEDEEIEEF
jgi:hypothetical protein